jgi:hypothetical protein
MHSARFLPDRLFEDALQKNAKHRRLSYHIRELYVFDIVVKLNLDIDDDIFREHLLCVIPHTS